MITNFSGLTNMFTQTDTHIEAKFVLDGKEYDIAHFNIGFTQEIDHKGKPQHETGGRRISIILSQSVEYSVIDWAKREYKRKDGQILFRSQTEGTVLDISFFNAYCIKFTKSVGAFSGTQTSLTISPEKVSLNGITHNKRWRE
ncbi:MAG: type VI secretion system needle protein Hcp [Prevotellaceae bacterium]|jgi:hypothetical protein|nr:type VI secretion system needle protein Hcp [Prevotellaceae bacterium]